MKSRCFKRGHSTLDFQVHSFNRTVASFLAPGSGLERWKALNTETDGKLVETPVMQNHFSITAFGGSKASKQMLLFNCASLGQMEGAQMETVVMWFLSSLQ